MRLASQIALGFLTAISIDLLDSYTNYTLTRQVKINSDFVANSEQIIRNSSTVNKGIIEMQSGLRGYLLTADTSFLDSYYNGLAEIPKLLNQQKGLAVEASQSKRLDSIIFLHNQWLAYANTLIAAKKKRLNKLSSETEFEQIFENQFAKQVGKVYNDRIADIFKLFDENEYRTREERRLALAASIDRTTKYSIAFSALIIVTSLSIAIYLIKKISNRIGSAVKQAENISKGNFTTVEDSKGDELSSLSVSLNAMSQKLSDNIGVLQKKNEELNQFAYVVSHDLKAPVRGISNVVQWIKEDLDSELSSNMKEYLDIIPRRVERMENLIDGLLLYARVGREKINKEEVNISELVRELAEMIVPKNYELKIINPPVFWTEKMPLQQVFANLLTNSVKFASRSDAIVEIYCSEKEVHYEFSVCDNGPGIDEKYHERIFGMFQTLRERNDHESTGIGLAIVKKIIEEVNGTIRVESALGKGARFIFTWPKI